jgi:hypothetical protein
VRGIKASLVLLALAGKAIAGDQCPVSWRPIMTAERPSTYFNFYDNHPDEFPGVPLQPAYDLPSDIVGCSPEGGCNVSCVIEDRFPWFVDVTGRDLTGTHPFRNPSIGNVSGNPESGVYGIEFVGTFEGGATGLPTDVVWQVVFFHQQKCYAGGNEYGFRREAVSGGFQFYWSINSNCSLDLPTATPPAVSFCRSQRGGEGRVQESTGAVVLQHHPGINRYQAQIASDPSDGKTKFLIRIYEPWDSAVPRETWVDPNAPGNWYPAPADPQALYPIDEMAGAPGYVTIGIQRPAAPTAIVADPEAPPSVRTVSLAVGEKRCPAGNPQRTPAIGRR